MMRRCYIEAEHGYKHYGGRGIVVCERWFDWRNFLEDMGERPEGLTLDRIDVNRGYEPGNCRWADRSTQARNTTKNVRVVLAGREMLACDAAAELGVHQSTIFKRRTKGTPLGERSPLKLRPEQVLEIKSRLSKGESMRSIAKDYGVTHQHVSGIKRGAVWNFVTIP